MRAHASELPECIHVGYGHRNLPLLSSFDADARLAPVGEVYHFWMCFRMGLVVLVESLFFKMFDFKFIITIVSVLLFVNLLWGDINSPNTGKITLAETSSQIVEVVKKKSFSPSSVRF